MENAASQQPKDRFSLLCKGYRYRRDKANRDGSMSLRCVRRDCAGRIKKLVDGTICCITQHNHESSAVKPQREKRTLLYEGYRYRNDRPNRDGSMSLRCMHRNCAGRIKKLADGTISCITQHNHGVSQQGKVAWLYEGYHYRCNKINVDGSLSLRCIRRDCSGSINKFVDGTTNYIIPHSHEPSPDVSQPEKENEEFHYQHDEVPEDSSMLLPEVSVTENNHESCLGTVAPQQGKERWLHEGFCYRCVGINRDGSMSLRCVHRGCAGRIKKLVDGTTIAVTMHSHALEVIKTETENIEADMDCGENVLNKFIDGTSDYITSNICEPCTVVTQPGKVSLLEEYHYQHDKVHQDSLLSLQEIGVTENKEGKRTWLHEGYRYRCVGINRDGSMSLRCVHHGCAGRIKRLVDGTTVTVTVHSHAFEVINTETENVEADVGCDENVLLLQSMIKDSFEFDLSLPPCSSSQPRKRKQDCIPDPETLSEIHTPGVLEVIMLKSLLHYVIGFSSNCFCCCALCMCFCHTVLLS